jgi:hypothetical protein
MITTTLNAIRAQHPCADGWEKLLRHLGKTTPDDEPLPLVTILESNGIDDALWCLRTVAGYDKEKRLFAVWCARQVVHQMTDPRSIAAIDVAERFAYGEATQEELEAARAAARAASHAANARVASVACMLACYAVAPNGEQTASRAAALAAAWADSNPRNNATVPAATSRAAQAEKFKEIFG